MKKLSLRFLVLAAVLGTAGMVLADNNADDETLKAVAGYRQWSRVTEKALPVIEASAGG
jgi:hypothetical protein